MEYQNKIFNCDVLEGLKHLPDECVNTVVTSPPYWGLRDYGTAEWIGGDPECNHVRHKAGVTCATGQKSVEGGIGDGIYKTTCKKCGAIREDKQLGLEETPEEYVAKMVEVFEEVRRVLRKDGTAWINMGDSYASDGKNRTALQASLKTGLDGAPQTQILKQQSKVVGDLKKKDLVGIPWMLAFALRGAGWWLRQDIIWHKPNTIPESVSDRCTKSHDYIFLLSKSQRYYYDQEAILQPASEATHARFSQKNFDNQAGGIRANGGTRPHRPMKTVIRGTREEGVKSNNDFHKAMKDLVPNVNKRSVWTVPARGLSYAHFATFPQELIVDCIKAGSPEGGLVLDPFMGSGTTAVVARKLNRDYVGFELNPDYMKIINRRLEEELGMFK